MCERKECKLKQVLRIAGLTLALMSAGFAVQAQAAEQKIAVLDLGKVMQQVLPAQTVEAKMKREFDSRVREMQKLESEGQALAAKLKKDEAFMSADERTKNQRKLAEMQSDFNLKGQALQEDQRRRFAEEQDKALAKIKSAVDSVAKEEGYDLVLNRQAVLFSASQLDISDKVIKQAGKSN